MLLSQPNIGDVSGSEAAVPKKWKEGSRLTQLLSIFVWQVATNEHVKSQDNNKLREEESCYLARLMLSIYQTNNMKVVDSHTSVRNDKAISAQPYSVQHS